jgi:peptidoglycan/LPS O-acetylase OafA/YrhL
MGNLKGLEVLRFLLSISVVVFHYQHFFHPFQGTPMKHLYDGRQPFASLFSLIYEYGYYAVPVFWLISGLIFYKVYRERIEAQRISFKEYTLNRISRLYPLHLLTLILVLCLQALVYEQYGKYFIYQANSVKNFFQNLFFVQSWGATKFSFNGPAWSVSVEIFVYLAFYLVCASGFIRRLPALLLTLLFAATVKKWELLFYNDDIRFCLLLFFVGCAFIFVYDRIKSKWLWQVMLTSVLTALWLLSVHIPAFLLPVYAKVTGRLELDVILCSTMLVSIFITLFNLPVFEKVNIKYFQYLGDMTYSTYMIHFPVQIILFLYFKPQNDAFYFDTRIFLIYLLSVLILGRVVFVFFERPLRSRLRKIAANV